MSNVVTTVLVPLLLSYFVSVKGVFSPFPPYCGYSKPSHFICYHVDLPRLPY